MEEAMNVEEVGKFLKLHPSSLRRKIKEGLPHYRTGRKLLFFRSEVLEWLRRQSQERLPREGNAGLLLEAMEKARRLVKKEDVEEMFSAIERARTLTRFAPVFSLRSPQRRKRRRR